MAEPGSAAIEPFRVEVPEAELEDLRARLAATRWPREEPVADWSQGVPLAYVRELCEYWGGEYDWRRAEASLNALPQFRTEIDGLGIYFIHVRSPHEDALPLVLTHGWPGSVFEFIESIGPLTDPTPHGGEEADAFHLVIPALPGYGFGDPPAETGWGVDRISFAWAELMARLGYERYGAQGGDWGSAVTRALARNDAAHLAGIHLNSEYVSTLKLLRSKVSEIGIAPLSSASCSSRAVCARRLRLRRGRRHAGPSSSARSHRPESRRSSASTESVALK